MDVVLVMGVGCNCAYKIFLLTVDHCSGSVWGP